MPHVSDMEKVTPAFKLFCVATIVAGIFKNSGAAAADYNGRVQVGVLQSNETYSEGAAGSYANDKRVALGRIYLDGNGIGPYRNKATFDFRDRYDAFGSLDKESLSLVQTNDPELRQLAVQYPYENGDLFWSVGRFPIEDAGVRANDGAEVAFKMSKSFHLGIFGGLVPEFGKGAPFLNGPKQTGREAGVYGTLLEKGKDWQDYFNLSSALVFRQYLEDEELDDAEEAAGQTPDQVVVNGAYVYFNSAYQPSLRTRLSLVSELGIIPNASLQSGWLNGSHSFTDSLSASAGLSRFDLAAASRLRDMRDALPASAYQEARVGVKQLISQKFSVAVNGLYANRTLDQLSKTEGNVLLTSSRFISNRFSGSFRLGARKNFQSQDQFGRVGLVMYGRTLEAEFGQEFIQELRDDGDARHPKITDASVTVMVDNQLVGSMTVEYAKDEQATLMSGIATIGYRFNSKEMPPIRDQAPDVGRL